MESWEGRLGREITLEGVAFDAKLGALLKLADGGIWLDREGWPGGFQGKKVRVTGTVIRRDDLPVFVEEPGERRAGIPVPPGTDLDKARVRYLLSKPTWVKLED